MTYSTKIFDIVGNLKLVVPICDCCGRTAHTFIARGVEETICNYCWFTECCECGKAKSDRHECFYRSLSAYQDYLAERACNG